MAGQHLKQSDYITVPWKNGLGTTVELASDGLASGTATGFLWRISIVDMKEGAVFSQFPGVDRILTVIEGDGLSLEGDALEHPLICEPYAPTAFSGDETLYGRLLADPVKNFNVMTDRPSACAKVSVLEVNVEGHEVACTGSVDFFHIPLGSAATLISVEGSQVLLNPGDSYVLLPNAKSGRLSYHSNDGAGKLIHVCITERTT